MCNNNFVTIYKKDYTPKKFTNTKKPKEINEYHKWKYVEFKNPINESFKNYLCLDPCEDEKFSEEVDTFFDKAIKKYPAFEYQTKNKPINKETVRNDKIFDGRSAYQADYCDLVKEIAEKEYAKRTAVHLPMDVYIPATIQKSSYRLPISINSKAYVRESLSRPKNSLDPNYKLREILQVKTGVTEYGAIIGKLGDRIVLEQLHGYIPKL